MAGARDLGKGAVSNPQASAVFGQLSKKEISQSIKQLLEATKNPGDVRALIMAHGPGSIAEREELFIKLMKRRAALEARLPEFEETAQKIVAKGARPRKGHRKNIGETGGIQELMEAGLSRAEAERAVKETSRFTGAYSGEMNDLAFKLKTSDPNWHLVEDMDNFVSHAPVFDPKGKSVYRGMNVEQSFIDGWKIPSTITSISLIPTKSWQTNIRLPIKPCAIGDQNTIGIKRKKSACETEWPSSPSWNYSASLN